MLSYTSRILLTLVLVYAALGAARAQESEERRVLAQRAAQADAYCKLIAALGTVKLADGVTVRDAADESTDVGDALDALVRGVKLGEPRFREDGSCEVSAEIDSAEAVDRIQKVRSIAPTAGLRLVANDSGGRRVIRVTGVGTARHDLPPGLPPGLVDRLTPAPQEHSRAELPELWRDVPARERIMAVEAARKDAQRKLAERIAGLRLTSRTSLGDLAPERDAIETELAAHLRGAHEAGPPYYHDDDLIVEVRMVAPADSVVTAVRGLESRFPEAAGLPRGGDLDRQLRAVVKRDIEAVGHGIPRAARATESQRPSGLTARARSAPIPDWATRDIDGEGRASGALGSAHEKLRLARAAENAARRKLAEAIAGLPLTDASRTVADFTSDKDEIAVLLDALVLEAAIVSTRFEAGEAVVVVRVPGMRVWDVLNDALRGK